MARRCAISGKRPLSGNTVSHSHKKTRRRQLPNLHTKRIFVPELGRHVRVRLSARALRTVTRKGLIAYLHDVGLRLQDVI